MLNNRPQLPPSSKEIPLLQIAGPDVGSTRAADLGVGLVRKDLGVASLAGMVPVALEGSAD